MKRILILSSTYTGHGHKSVSDALVERLSDFDDIEARAMDGFELMNKFQQYMAEYTYGPITRMPGKAWEWNYAAGLMFMKPVTKAVASMIRSRLLTLLEGFRPDAIVSVHPMFLGAVADVLDKAGLDIPLIGHEVDLMDIADYWFDPRIDLVLAPSQEAYDCTIAHGVPVQKARQVRFPVRRRFMNVPPTPHEGTVLTVMSGAEGSGMVYSVTHALLKHTDAVINVICGRNKKLRTRLRRSFGRKYRGRISVLGFVEDIERVMAGSDVLIMRASPNSAMEAVAMRTPVILFGQLAGQEAHNPDVLMNHGLAWYCPKPAELAANVRRLMADGGAEAERMRQAQRDYMPGDPAFDTAALLRDYVMNHA